jgi:phosphoadenosine phosphosulfate reductase
LAESISRKKSVVLFTGDIGSTLLLDAVKDLNVDIVFIDTCFHFNEIMVYVKSCGDKVVVIKNSDVPVKPEDNMDQCCYQRKAEMLKVYLDSRGAQCLIVPFIDEEHAAEIESSYLSGIDNVEIIKPLYGIAESDIWTSIKERRLPFSKIYNKGYKSIDCRYCTTRHGRKKQDGYKKAEILDKKTEEKLKALGYM